MRLFPIYFNVKISLTDGQIIPQFLGNLINFHGLHKTLFKAGFELFGGGVVIMSLPPTPLKLEPH